MLELKGGLCPTLGCSQIKAQRLGRTVSVCYRGLGKRCAESNGVFGRASTTAVLVLVPFWGL